MRIIIAAFAAVLAGPASAECLSSWNCPQDRNGEMFVGGSGASSTRRERQTGSSLTYGGSVYDKRYDNRVDSIYESPNMRAGRRLLDSPLDTPDWRGNRRLKNSIFDD